MGFSGDSFWLSVGERLLEVEKRFPSLHPNWRYEIEILQSKVNSSCGFAAFNSES